MGPILAVVGMASGLRRKSAVADDVAGETRLAAEVDRSMRYHRPFTIALIRCANDSVVDAMARTLRTMDLLAEDAGDDYLVILPECARTEGSAAIERLLDFARAANVEAKAALATCPEDGTSVETLIGCLRAGMRTGRHPSAGAAANATPADGPIVLDPAMHRVYALVERIADTPMTVLILGETGTGKELVAEAIHQRSGRRDKPLIKLNCAALPETLLESELFGYERGAFTGADRREGGLLRGRGRRHDVPRRDRRDAAGVAGQAAARARAAGDPPRRGQSPSGRSTCASSPPPTATSRARSSAGASAQDLLLPARRRHARRAAAARARNRRS